MGIFRTFREAFNLRLDQLKQRSYLGKTIPYMGKRRIVYMETAKDVYLKGIAGPVSKNFLNNVNHGRS